MDCADAKLRMEPYASGALAAEERGDFDRHLAECEGCRLEMELVRAMGTQKADAPGADEWTLDRIFGGDAPPETRSSTGVGHSAASGGSVGVAPPPSPAPSPAPPPAFRAPPRPSTPSQGSLDDLELETREASSIAAPGAPSSGGPGAATDAKRPPAPRSESPASWDFEPADAKRNVSPPEKSLFFAEETLSRQDDPKGGKGSIWRLALWGAGGVLGVALLGLSVWIAIAVREPAPDVGHPFEEAVPTPSAEEPPAAEEPPPADASPQTASSSGDVEAYAPAPAGAPDQAPQSPPTPSGDPNPVPPAKPARAPVTRTQSLPAPSAAKPAPAKAQPKPSASATPVSGASRPAPGITSDEIESSDEIELSELGGDSPESDVPFAGSAEPQRAIPASPTARSGSGARSPSAVKTSPASPDPVSPAPVAPGRDVVQRPIDRLHLVSVSAEQNGDLAALRKMRGTWRSFVKSSVGPDRARAKRELADCLWAIQVLTGRASDKKDALAAYRDYLLNAPAGGADARTVSRMRQLEDALAESR